MWFGNKRKINRNLRFQHKSFTNRLGLARQHKRIVKKISENSFERILSRLGLSSLFSRAALVSVVLFLLYLVYVPNFLFIKHIQIDFEQKSLDTQPILNSIADYFNAPGFWPQKNIVFLNTDQLAKYLKVHHAGVADVVSVKRHLWNKLSIQLRVKVEKFLVKTGEKTFLVYEDGTVSRQLAGSEAENLWKNSTGLIKVGVEFLPGSDFGTAPVSTQAALGLLTLDSFLQHQQDLILNYVQVPLSGLVPNESKAEANSPLSLSVSQEAHLNTVSGRANLNPVPDERRVYAHFFKDTSRPDPSKQFYAILDLTEDTAVQIQKLLALVKQMTPERKAGLAYIDLRFANRAYECARISPCALQITEPARENNTSIIESGDKIKARE